jgi:hypothetical protein
MNRTVQKSRGKRSMIVQVRLKGAHWMLAAIFALTPIAGLAQQEGDALGPSQQDQDQPDAAEVRAEEPRENSEARQTETEEVQGETENGPKVISGMSILGNQEAPTSLVIVPWKSSQIGDSVGISTMLDDSKQPVDREVFMRALRYYEIRSETTP